MSKTPKLRFPEFSGEWEERKLKDFSVKITQKNKDFLIKNVISNSAKNGLISQRNYFDKDIANKENINGYYIIETGNFVYNPRKSIESPYGPINRYNLKEKGVVSPLYLCFSIKDDVNEDFLEQYFKSSKWYGFVYKNSDQGARHDRVSIKDSEVFNLGVMLPGQEEQQKIASFLSLVDKKIEKQSEKVEAIKEYKKGMMQKIFSREIRFKDDEGKEFPEWEEKKLKALIYNKKKGNQPAYSDCGNILLSNEYLENKFSTVYVKNPIDVEYDDVLILWDGSQAGKCYTGVKGVLGSTFVSLTLKKDISPVYIYQYLSFKIDIIKLAWREGSGVPHVSKDFINNFKINICCIKEQKKIANFLSTIDKKLKKEEEKLEALRAWKKGLLQQMFV